MVNDDIWGSRDPKRKSKGVFYSHTGLVRVALRIEFGNEEVENAMRNKLDQLIVHLYELQKERDPLKPELKDENASLKDRIAFLKDRVATLENRYLDKEKKEIEKELENIEKKRKEWDKKHERLKAVNEEIEKLIEGSGEERNALVAVIAADENVKGCMARFKDEIEKLKKEICELNIFRQYTRKVFDKIWEEIRRKVRDTEEKSLEDIENETGNMDLLRDLIPRVMVDIFLQVLGYEKHYEIEHLRKSIVINWQRGKEVVNRQIPNKSTLMFLIEKVFEEKDRIIKRMARKGTLKPGAAIMESRVLGEMFKDDGVFVSEEILEFEGTGILRLLYEGKKRELKHELKKKGKKLTDIELFGETQKRLLNDDVIPLLFPDFRS